MIELVQKRIGIRVVTIALVAVAALQVGMLYARAPHPPERVKPGDRFGAIATVTSGVPVMLDLAKLPACTFVIFTEPTCPTCEREAPTWAKTFGDSTGWKAVAISFGDWTSSHAFASSHALTVPLFAVERPDRMAVSRAVRVPAVPTLVVLGERGTVRAVAGPSISIDSLARIASCPRGGRPSA